MAGNWEESHETNSTEDDYSLPFSDNEELECFNNSRGSEDSCRGESSAGESRTKGLMMVGGLPVEMIVTDEPSTSQTNDGLKRRSGRVRRGVRSYSPILQKRKGGKKKQKRSINGLISEPPPFDVLPDGTPFNCDLCRSPYICNSGRRVKTNKPPKSNASPRHRRDPKTGKVLLLCNACGLRYDKKPRAPKPPVNQQEKEEYLKKAHSFGLWLASLLSDPDAERLACPVFKAKGCMCIQYFITGDGESNGVNERALQLLSLLKEAKRLSALRFNDTARDKTSQPRLCNGHKKAPEFEEFVIQNRCHLKENLKLCERAAQRVLFYSNNFLHKRLKTDARTFRIKRSKGRGALGLLTPIDHLPNERCCVDNCVSMALTHEALLSQWRTRAGECQTEMRRVIAEMLTPSGGARPNCNNFIRWVTGGSCSTISKVRSQMRETGGRRDPPIHGLKRRWQGIKATVELNNRKEISLINPCQIQYPPIAKVAKMRTGKQTVKHTVKQPQPKRSAEPDKLETISATRQQILVLERQLAKQQQQLKALLNQVNAAAPSSSQVPTSQQSAEGEEVAAGNALVSLMETSTSASSSPASASRMTSPDNSLLTLSLASPQQTSEGLITSELFSNIHFILSENQTLQNQSPIILLPTSTSLTMATGATTTNAVSTSSPVAQMFTTASSSQQTLLSLLKPEFTQNILPSNTSTGEQHTAHEVPSGGQSGTTSCKQLQKSDSLLGFLSSNASSEQRSEDKLKPDTMTSLVANTLSVVDSTCSNAANSAVINISPRTLYPVCSSSRESQSHSGNGDENNGQVEAVVQQILDLTGNIGLVSISPSKANSFLHQLSEYGSTIAPNVNISLLQPTVSEGSDGISQIHLPHVHQEVNVAQVLNQSISDGPGTSQSINKTINPVTIPLDQNSEHIDNMLDPTSMAPLKYVLTIEQGAGGDTTIPISLETVDSLESPSVFHEDQSSSSRGQDGYVSVTKDDANQAIDLMQILTQRVNSIPKNASQY